MQKLLSPKILAKTIAAGLIIMAAAVLLGVQIHKRIIESRMVTQEQIEAGWAAAGIMLEEQSSCCAGPDDPCAEPQRGGPQDRRAGERDRDLEALSRVS
jgi:hypothetical protein